MISQTIANFNYFIFISPPTFSTSSNCHAFFTFFTFLASSFISFIVFSTFYFSFPLYASYVYFLFFITHYYRQSNSQSQVTIS